MKYIVNKNVRLSIVKILFSQFLLSGLELFNIYVLYKILVSIINYIQNVNDFVIISLSDNLNFNLTFNTIMVLFISYTLLKLLITLIANKIKHLQIIAISEDISNRIFKNYFNRDYIDLKGINTSTILQHVRGEPVFLTRFVIAFSTLLTEFFVFSGLIIALLVIDTELSIYLIILVSVFSVVFFLSVKNKLKTLGEKRYKFEQILVSSVIQIFDGIREIIMYSKKKYFANIFLDTNKIRHSVVATNNYYLELPKIFLELILNVCVIGGAFYFTNIELSNYNYDGLVFFVLAAFRIIPSINKMIASFQDIAFNSTAVKEIDKILSKETNDDEETSFLDKYKFKEIKLVNIEYSYQQDKQIIKDLSFTIKANNIIGIFGKSGTGKSTLIDLVSNLIKFQKGQIFIDDIRMNDFNKKYKFKIGYVSQKPYLLKSSLLENIILGGELDEKKILEIISMVNLDFVNHNISDIKEFYINEGASNLSGGQIQRIALARALYHEPQLLLLDEFTSALDPENENNILKIISNLKSRTTIMIITHKKSTLKICDKFIELT